MVRLSVNVNKIALIRNSRGGPIPDVLEAARTCLDAGCHGITVHPRPDARHITHRDVFELSEMLRRDWKRAEFNIEGYPNPAFIDLVSRVVPDQVTLVPDPPDALTSNQGWKFNESTRWLADVIHRLRQAKMRVSVFVEPESRTVENAKAWSADRIELYTGPYAHAFGTPQCAPILKAHIEAARLARRLGLGINAGHDLNLDNLPAYVREVSGLMEVSIGHALICDAIYKGLKRTVGLYLKAVGRQPRESVRAGKK